MAIQTRHIIKCYGCGEEIETSEISDARPWTEFEANSVLLGRGAEVTEGSRAAFKDTFCGPSCLSHYIVCKLYENLTEPTLKKFAAAWMQELEEVRRGYLAAAEKRKQEATPSK